MAIMDERTLFGENFDIGQATGSYLMTNQVDLGLTGRDIGNGYPVYLNIVIDEAVTSGTSSTVAFELRSDAAAAINTSTGSLHFSSGAIAHTALTLGTKLSFFIPLNNAVPYERYLGCIAVVAGATTTAGTCTAWLGLEPVAGWKAYPEGSN